MLPSGNSIRYDFLIFGCADAVGVVVVLTTHLVTVFVRRSLTGVVDFALVCGNAGEAMVDVVAAAVVVMVCIGAGSMASILLATCFVLVGICRGAVLATVAANVTPSLSSGGVCSGM